MNYFILTVKHKLFVFLAGLCTGAPIWNLIIHDWSKFTRNEYPHYQKQFFGDKSDPEGFIKAWIHHQNHNPHHWEYWIPRTGHGRCTPPYKDNEPVKMPDCYVKEMIADWLGAGRAYNKTWPDESHWMWFWENFDRMILHPETRNDVVIRVKKLQDSRLYKYLKKYV